MVGKTKAPTPEEQNRMSWISQQYGCCIPCLLSNRPQRAATVQHVVEGRKRLGHESTYGSCVWCHLGQPPELPSPSLQHGKKIFQAHFGSETMLCDLQTFLIDAWRIHFWVPYQMPPEVISELRSLWVKLRADDPYYEER